MNKEYLKLYIGFLKEFLRIKRPVKIVFDSSNGTTGLVLKNLLKAKSSKLKAKFINDKPDGNFPAHGPNPLLKGATAQLEKEVKKQKADLGIIFDGDGDRVFFVDNRGRWVDANEIGYILMQNFKPPYVAGIVSSWRLKKLKVESEKRQVLISRTGHYFFKKLMREKKANLGVEHSGHYYFKDFFYCDAGIFAAVFIINFVSGLKTDLASWLDKLPKYYRSGEINFSAKGGPASGWEEKMMKKIEKKYKKQGAKISKLDGLTVEFNPSPLRGRLLSKRLASQPSKGEGWFNLRPSNTEDLLRLNMEATDKKILQDKLAELRGDIK